MSIIYFGDTNTCGYDYQGYFDGRYAADSRWADILAGQSINMGQSSWEISSTAPSFPADTNLRIVMLGINDLLQGSSPEQAVERVEYFLCGISLEQSEILLIAPLPMVLGVWMPSLQAH